MVGLRGAQILCSAAAGSMEGERGWGAAVGGHGRLTHLAGSQVSTWPQKYQDAQ